MIYDIYIWQLLRKSLGGFEPFPSAVNHDRGNRGWRVGWSREEEKRNNMRNTSNRSKETCVLQ